MNYIGKRNQISFLFLAATMVVALAQQGNAGTCDIYAASGTPCGAAYSMVRALYNTYNGPLYQIRRADNTLKDIGLLSVGGYVDAATQDSFCTGTTCTISIIYDQSGKGNHLRKAPGGTAGGQPNQYGPNPDIEAVANDLPIYIGGHKAYGLRVTPNTSWTGTTQVGYRTTPGSTTGLATGNNPETIYEVTDGSYFNGSCCFDFGNTETQSVAGGNGAMEAIYFGNVTWWDYGQGKGPWIMADLEVGVYNMNGVAGDTNTKDISFTYPFVTAMLKGDSTANASGGPFTLKGGNAQSGSLITVWDGARPTGYSKMTKQGGVILGVGGDNSGTSKGDFYEGVLTLGFASTATDAAIQANIVAAGFGNSSLTSSSSVSSSSKASSSSSVVLSSSRVASSSSSSAASSNSTTSILPTENLAGVLWTIKRNNIALHLDHAVQGSLEVLNLLGVQRQQLSAGFLGAGDHSYPMAALPNGVYFVRLTSGQEVITHKFAVVSP